MRELSLDLAKRRRGERKEARVMEGDEDGRTTRESKRAIFGRSRGSYG